MSRWQVLSECPDWPVVGVIPRGSFQFCQVELFAQDSSSPATHAHFYSDIVRARRVYKLFKELFPTSVVSVSFDKGVNHV